MHVAEYESRILTELNEEMQGQDILGDLQNIETSIDFETDL
jgi:hypothetical protein